MSMLDRRRHRDIRRAARRVAFALLAIGAASLRVGAEGAGQSPGATPAPAPAEVRFELASIRRNLEAEQQRAAVPMISGSSIRGIPIRRTCCRPSIR